MSKEDIKKAKAENAERIANIAYSGGGHIGQDDLETAFENGAEWRIESVWHRDEEEAEVGSLILIKSRQRKAVILFISIFAWLKTSALLFILNVCFYLCLRLFGFVIIFRSSYG